MFYYPSSTYRRSKKKQKLLYCAIFMKFNTSFKERVEHAIKNGKELVDSFNDKSIQNVVLWLDLLGFQKQLLTDKKTALLRISVFHELTLTSVSDELHIAQLNDATVISMDFENDDNPENLTRFLAKCDTLFEMSTYADREVGGFGTRGVITLGLRQGLRGNFGGIALDQNLTVDKIRFSSPIAIMMNMAFAKSYHLESSGGLLKEPSLYIEECLMNNYEIMISPHWDDHGRFDYNGNRYVIVRRDQE